MQNAVEPRADDADEEGGKARRVVCTVGTVFLLVLLPSTLSGVYRILRPSSPYVQWEAQLHT